MFLYYLPDTTDSDEFSSGAGYVACKHFYSKSDYRSTYTFLSPSAELILFLHFKEKTSKVIYL